MDLAPGQIVDRYAVESLLGTGGMAVVYKVRHRTLGSVHALKILTLGGRRLQERLLQEGRIQAQVRHPNLVPVTDVIDVDGQVGLVLDFVEGPSLEALLRRGPLPAAQAEGLFRGVLAGVALAHAQGMVHRDLKPANILLAPLPEGGWLPRVSDFGVARVQDAAGGGMGTRTGMMVGTPGYMAPEQADEAKSVDARADIFSLGVILYEMTTGVRPFHGDALLSLLNAVADGTYMAPELRRHDLPGPLREVIVGCLEVEPERRLPSCGAILAILDRSPAAGAPAPRPPSGASTVLLGAGPTLHPSPSADPVAPTEAGRTAGLSGRSTAPRLVLAGLAAVALLSLGGVGLGRWLSTTRPTAAPTEVTAEVPTDAPTEVPTQATTDSPTGVPPQAPPDAPTVAPVATTSAPDAPERPPREASAARAEAPSVVPPSPEVAPEAPAAPASVRINALPPGSLVIDGVSRGQTPFIGTLPVGAHHITLTSAEGLTVERSLTVGAEGATLCWDFDVARPCAR